MKKLSISIASFNIKSDFLPIKLSLENEEVSWMECERGEGDGSCEAGCRC